MGVRFRTGISVLPWIYGRLPTQMNHFTLRRGGWKVAEVERSSAAPCWDNVLLSYASITVNDPLPKWLPHRLCAAPFGVLSWRVLLLICPCGVWGWGFNVKVIWGRVPGSRDRVITWTAHFNRTDELKVSVFLTYVLWSKASFDCGGQIESILII